MSPRVMRRAAVLPMVLVVMVIIALAACAALFVARQERTASWNTRLQTSALGAADGAQATMRSELAGIAHTLATGASIVRDLPATPMTHATARLSRLGPTLFMLTADAGARSEQGLFAQRRASLLLHLEPVAVAFPAALGITGPEPAPVLTDGIDRPPDGWPCGTPRPDTAAVRHPSPAPDSSTLADLRSRAAIALPAGSVVRGVQPAVRDGACVTERTDNWGDPRRAGACASWMPIIHAAGDLTVDGGAGQGVLVVDGDLAVGGGFRFTGAVIVAGSMDIASGGASFTGGVIAEDVTDHSGTGDAHPIVLRSTCAVSAALLAAGVLLPVVDRAWASAR